MCSQGVTWDVWIAMGVHLGCYVGCVDSDGCVLRVLRGMCGSPWVCSQGVTWDVWIAMGVHFGCYVGCVDNHGCVLRVLRGMCG